MRKDLYVNPCPIIKTAAIGGIGFVDFVHTSLAEKSQMQNRMAPHEKDRLGAKTVTINRSKKVLSH
jgi:hypothetical protein